MSPYDDEDLFLNVVMWSFFISAMLLFTFCIMTPDFDISWTKSLLIMWSVCFIILYIVCEYFFIKGIRDCECIGNCLCPDLDDGRGFGFFLVINFFIMIYSAVVSGGFSVLIYLFKEVLISYFRNIMLVILCIGGFLIIKLLLYKYAIGGKKQ